MTSGMAEFNLPLIWLISFCSFFSSTYPATDTLTSSETLRDNQTLVSAGGVFELGFFRKSSMGHHYLGIWLTNYASMVVWVNRDFPLLNSTGLLQIRSGNLALMDQRQEQFILNSANIATTNTSATLFDTGNFVLKEVDTDTIIWQSFDFPSDTYLPGMKLGYLNRQIPTNILILVSWTSPENPDRGLYTLAIDISDLTKLSVWRADGLKMAIASWNEYGFRFIFENSSTGNNDYNFSFESNRNEYFYTFSSSQNSSLMWFVLASTGNLDQYFMSDGKITSVSHRLCADSAGGNTGTCLDSLQSVCTSVGSFFVMNGSLPSSFGDFSSGSSDCQTLCKTYCYCTAFASQNESLCQIYWGSKQNLFKIIEKGTGLVYIRNDATLNDAKKRKLLLAIGASLASLFILVSISLSCYVRWRRRHKDDQLVRPEGIVNPNHEVRGVNNMKLGRQKDPELPLFSFYSLKAATNDFAKANKLGEGGFGPVYKGWLLPEGQEIAVKRLSKISRQGLKEFQNEISVICKLQHRNLVRLLGCCIEAEESILIYDYMPNNSLDSFIFDSTKQLLLDWTKRMNIIEGIAQGLLYLHKYSRLRIIHRDLKTSNILLDSDMNPKISDFGMARIFKDNDTRGQTNRIVGTFGYMSPEYAMDGLFSEKSDVFSFGVILLEIISGKKNIAFFEADQSLNLPGKAWNLWKESKSMELMDSTLSASCSSSEVMRCIQMGLLCVQERATDRPTMSDVVAMLRNETIALPLPKEPAFLYRSADVDSSSCTPRPHSRNDITISEVDGR